VSSRDLARRPRAPQGSGEQLRAEIVAAATSLLVQSGNPEHVTLRAVARTVGIAAPSIYLHFADRNELLVAVLDDAQQRFEHALRRGDPGEGADPLDRCRRIGVAYARFAEKQKGAYQILFNGLLPIAVLHVDVRTVEEMPPSFAVLYRACAGAVHAAQSDMSPMSLALQVWCGLHGFVTLKANMPGFPWSSAAAYIDEALMPLIPNRVLRLTLPQGETAD
jgi:AcrR family transcriptional regulator